MEEQIATNSIDYLWVLDYLENNQEIPYSNPEAPGINPEEKARLLLIKEKGQKAASELKKMVTECQNAYKLDSFDRISWLDTSRTKTRKYLWVQMKYKKYANDPFSISIFVEKSGHEGKVKLRISLELKNDGADAVTVAKYHSFLEKPIDFNTGLVLVTGSNEWGRPEVISESQEETRNKVRTGKYTKVQLCKYIERKTDETNDYYHQEFLKAVEQLIPYYQYVLGIENEEWWPSKEEYNPGISVDKWVDLLQDPEVTKEENLRMFAIMIAMGGAATCAKMSELYGNEEGRYNNCGRTFAERVHKKTNCPLFIDKDDNNERKRSLI